MIFSKAFGRVLEAIQAGRITDAHLDAMADDPDRVLREPVTAAPADALAPPRAPFTAAELRRRRASYSELSASDVRTDVLPLRRAEYDGATYVVVGETVWGPFQAAYDLQWAEGKPLYRAQRNDLWQVFHGEDGSTTYLDVSSLIFVGGQPLYPVQLHTEKWSVAHGTTVYRPCDRVSQNPGFAYGKPYYVATLGEERYAAHGDQLWRANDSNVLVFAVIAGKPFFQCGWSIYHGHTCLASAMMFRLLGTVDGEPVYIAGDGYANLLEVYHGSKVVARRVIDKQCSLKGNVLRVAQNFVFPISLVRAPRQADIHLGKASEPLALPSGDGGPYRALPPGEAAVADGEK
ncbi:MAG: hypothetical protein AAB974_00725 [Patescibacteria group bacterium]